MSQLKSFKIIYSRDGQTMQYLHTDAVPLGRFGPREVTRASDVEFDHTKQEWYAALMDGQEIARHPTRDAVLAQERTVIEDMLTRGEPIPGCTAPA